MCTVICPKCKQPVTVTDSKGYVVCSSCNEVIFVLTKREVEIFFNEINNPRQPNEALKNAAYNKKNATP
jgi:uncharacterized Zn finger protein (UPF0148 family)